MKNMWLIKSFKARIAVACGAGIAYGNMVGRVASEHLGPMPGVVIGLLAMLLLAYGFHLNLEAMAKSDKPAEDR